MTKQVIDLNAPPAGHTVDVRLTVAETDADRKTRIFKDLAVFFVAMVFCIIILGFAAYVVVTDGAANESTYRWALSILSGGVGGLLGYLVKK